MTTMPAVVAIVVYSVLWAGFGVASGLVFAKLPERLFATDTFVTAIRSWERDGRSYERWFRIRRWKDRLPEAGALFSKGGSIASLPTGPAAGDKVVVLRRFAAGTRRAEWVHWTNAAFGLTFFAWEPWPIGVIMTAFGVIVHVPFIMVQRFNRPRALALAAKIEQRRTPLLHHAS